MPDDKKVYFFSLGAITLLQEARQDDKTIYFDAKTNRGDSFVVVKYLIAEDYKVIQEKIFKLGNSIFENYSASYTEDHYVAKRPMVGGYPIRATEWKDITIQLDTCHQLCKAFDEIETKSFFIKSFTEKSIGIDPQGGKVSLDILNNIEQLKSFDPELIIPGRYILPKEEMADLQSAAPKAVSYTLAVLLFEILFGSHPYEGRKLAAKAFISPEDYQDNYGTKRVFIFDPENTENAPVPGLQNGVIRRWETIPEELRDAFIKVFVRKEVLSPKNWIDLIQKSREHLFTCPGCGRQTFIKLHDKKSCIWCGRALDTTYTLKDTFNSKEIPLIEGADIINPSNTKEVFGKVIRNNDKLLIQNATKSPWEAITPKGVNKQVEPGGFMPVNAGIKVKIGVNSYIIEQKHE